MVESGGHLSSQPTQLQPEADVSPFDLLDALTEAFEASSRLDDAVRNNVATTGAVEVFRDRYRRVVDLAYELAYGKRVGW